MDKKIELNLVVNELEMLGCKPHDELAETKYIKPMQYKNHVIAINKAGSFGIWCAQSSVNDLDSSLTVVSYDQTSHNAEKYGRNSNLKKYHNWHLPLFID
ncbi:hypothetical protein CTM70_07415 [Photobacterium phosphoreum]|uniref:hypothetical protein n=2 Tax=Photobacterium phosphoreum TaxID=659 RepID=UPI000D15E782|nr:hypothetical protein [Photobacterium phosphoreum]PSW41425.1 hypothetical protein CTM70_07415 [Photobacterium phosphoreum]